MTTREGVGAPRPRVLVLGLAAALSITGQAQAAEVADAVMPKHPLCVRHDQP